MVEDSMFAEDADDILTKGPLTLAQIAEKVERAEFDVKVDMDILAEEGIVKLVDGQYTSREYRRYGPE